jgi:hypothetical protein
LTLDELKTSMLAKLPTSQQAAASAFIAQYGPTLLTMGVDWAWTALEKAVVKGTAVQAYADILKAKSAADPFLADEAATLAAGWQANANANAAQWATLNQIGTAIKEILVACLLTVVGL